MTTLVKYNKTPSYNRVLGAADLRKAGVEGFTSTTFPGGVYVEVADDVAKALTDPTSVLFEKGEFVIAPSGDSTSAPAAVSTAPGNDEDLEDDADSSVPASSDKKK